MEITEREASTLLYIFDHYFWTDETSGKVDSRNVRIAGSVKEAQILRNKLVSAHEHITTYSYCAYCRKKNNASRTP